MAEPAEPEEELRLLVEDPLDQVPLPLLLLFVPKDEEEVALRLAVDEPDDRLLLRLEAAGDLLLDDLVNPPVELLLGVDRFEDEVNVLRLEDEEDGRYDLVRPLVDPLLVADRLAEEVNVLRLEDDEEEGGRYDDLLDGAAVPPELVRDGLVKVEDRALDFDEELRTEELGVLVLLLELYRDELLLDGEDEMLLLLRELLLVERESAFLLLLVERDLVLERALRPDDGLERLELDTDRDLVERDDPREEDDRLDFEAPQASAVAANRKITQVPKDRKRWVFDWVNMA